MSKKTMPGDRYGRLTVLELLHRSARCTCSCGNETVVLVNNLRRGNTTSCGCVWYESVACRTKHGGSNTPEYRSWSMMRNRCLNKSAGNYPYYGGRGVSICARWDDFSSFLEDMGTRPSPAHSLDRIDNEGDYEPEN